MTSPMRRLLRSRGAADATSAREPRFDPASWVGAIIVMAGVGAVLWIVQIVNAQDDYRLDRFGLKPRDFDGLWGVLTAPFLHASYSDMLADTLPVVLIGWVLLLAGVRTWLTVTGFVLVVGGLLAWLVGPGGALIIGANGVVFGWIGYLVTRAVLSRKIRWIVVAIMVLLVFGALLGQLVPVAHSQETWQAHLAGFVAGVGIGAVLHPRKKARRTQRSRGRSVVS